MASCASLLAANKTHPLCVTNSSVPTTTRHRLTGVSSWDDATWVMSSAFIIFTMQSGFGLLESGMVSRKNEVNIMVKNVVDVIFGGLSFWAFGYAFAFGDGSGSNPFCGVGRFFTDATQPEMGNIFSKFFFQLSFATTAMTIVSGSMAERTKLESYCLFSTLGILIYCFPAHWMWAHNGWLAQLGVVDIAGCGVVHVVGGVTGLTATIYLKPRISRFSCNQPLIMGSPVTAILGLFVLWWGWLGFNCGSTFGITGEKWQLAARAAVNTLNASIGGGIFAFVYSYVYFTRKVDVSYVIVGILGGLVSVTGICPLARPWESLIIGAIGGMLGCFGRKLIERLKIDDPTGCLAAHTLSGIWGLLSVGFFTEIDNLENFSTLNGVFKGGSGWLLGVQLLAIVVLIAWSAAIATLFLVLLDKLIGLRVSEEEEKLGSDIVEHDMDYNKTENSKQSKALISLNLFISKKIEPQKRRHEIRDESGQTRATAFTVKLEEIEEETPTPYTGRHRAGAVLPDTYDESSTPIPSTGRRRAGTVFPETNNDESSPPIPYTGRCRAGAVLPGTNNDDYEPSTPISYTGRRRAGAVLPDTNEDDESSTPIPYIGRRRAGAVLPDTNEDDESSTPIPYTGRRRAGAVLPDTNEDDESLTHIYNTGRRRDGAVLPGTNNEDDESSTPMPYLGRRRAGAVVPNTNDESSTPIPYDGQLMAGTVLPDTHDDHELSSPMPSRSSCLMADDEQCI